MSKKVMLVFGTRPEAIKMCPLVNELKNTPGIDTVVCVTGQHREMLHQVLEVFGVKPDYDLGIMKSKQDLFDITCAVLENIKPVLEKEAPDVVLVHGDTSTTYAAALACFYKNIKVGHVEAGLRTYDMHSPYPEEFNRQSVGLLADYHFAPTQLAKENLLREGKPEESIFVTGNTVIDALKTTVREDYDGELVRWAEGSRLILLTAHRRENLGEGMHRMFRAIRRISDEFPDVKILYPVHKNPAVRAAAQEHFSGTERIRLVEPMDVFDFHNILARCCLVMTDSGGIQEEAPAFGKPVLVMRDTTERPEGVTAGTLRLVGTDEENVYSAARLLLTDSAEYGKMAHAVNPYGDGNASARIAEILKNAR